jgi:hypothetical protein
MHQQQKIQVTPTHLSCEELEAYLTQIGIKVPANIPKIVLRKLLIENMNM